MIEFKKYRTLWFFLLIGGLGILQTPAHATPGPTGSELLEVCVSRLSIAQTQCIAFISGVTAGHALSVGTGKTFYCLPERAGMAEVKRIVVKYLKKHSKSRDQDAAELIFRALANTWPCGSS